MAKAIDMDMDVFEEWLSTKPRAIKDMAAKLPPDRLYKLKDGGHRVTLYSYDENKDGSVSMTVLVTGEFNCVTFDRKVFGINPEDLEECDLPKEDEKLGTLLEEQDDIDAFIEVVRGGCDA
jgi:hypothetical protein